MFNSHNLFKGLLVLALTLGLHNSATPSTETVLQPVAKSVDNKQLQCLADNIFFEAAGEPTEGKAAVARVVVNRINHGYANTICQVVYQTKTVQQTTDDDEQLWVKACQFAWVCEGKRNPNRNTHAYQKSLQIAREVLIYDMHKEVIPQTVLFFHNLTVTPKLKYTYKKRIGNHIFYSKKKRR